MDPRPEPTACFLDDEHVTKLTEKAKTAENTDSNDSLTDDNEPREQEESETNDAKHKPRRLLRTVISSMKNSKEFGVQMAREATRRRFDEANRKAFVASARKANGSTFIELSSLGE